MLMITTESFMLLTVALLSLGAVIIWIHGSRCYDRGITDAILMHREGRLKYNTYLDDDGKKMVNIEIEPLEDE
jgi:hypothetical protein